MPHEAGAIWQAFLELHCARPAGMGASPILFTEIEAWQRVNGITFTPWEISCIVAMDRKALDVAAEIQQRNAR